MDRTDCVLYSVIIAELLASVGLVAGVAYTMNKMGVLFL